METFPVLDHSEVFIVFPLELLKQIMPVEQQGTETISAGRKPNALLLCC